MIRTRRIGVAFACVTLLSILTSTCRAEADSAAPSDAEIGEEQVYSTPTQAMDEIFPTATRVDSITVSLTDDERVRLQEQLGFGDLQAGSEVVLRRPYDDAGQLLGYGLVAEEVGKYRPFTFLVGANPELEVEGVEVLVYRESRGGEVRRTRFLRQYRGKDTDDDIRINRDILNIAGATLSVRALNRGVRRALLTLELLTARDSFLPAVTEEVSP